MKTTNNNGRFIYWVFGIIGALLLIIFLFKDCKGETAVVTIPEVKGRFDAVKPLNKALIDVSRINEVNKKHHIPDVGKTIKYQKLIDSLLNRNIELEIAFAKSKNKDSLYKEAIRLNSFSQTFDNDTIKIDVKGIAKGTVESIGVEYKIKSKKETIKIPVTVFRLLGGIETGMTKDLSKFNIKANLGVQNKAGSIFSASFDSQQRIYLGYTTSIFQIKK